MLLALVLACAHPRPEPAAPGVPDPEAVRGVTDPTLRAVLADQWESSLRRSPLGASRLGEHQYDALLDDISADAVAANRAADAALLARVEAINAGALTTEDSTTVGLLLGELRSGQATAVCHSEQWGLSARNNPLITIGELGELQPIVTQADAANYLARVRALPKYIDDDRAHLASGIAAGRTPDAGSVRIVLEQITTALAQPPTEWATMIPANTGHPDWPKGADATFRSDLLKILHDDVTRALAAYRSFLAVDLLPAARGEDRAGVWALPEGGACYAALIQAHTSLALPAADLHATGLAELRSIHAEMLVLGERLFGTKDIASLFTRLRGDPALRFTTAEEVEQKAVTALAAAKARVPTFFGTLPKADCLVRRIPDYEAPYTTIAYYRQVVPGEQPGYYYINTYQPETRPRYEAEVLAFHESIPGHHFQIAIGQELAEMPAFRKNLMTTAFVEGWALYTERLADEMGLYSGDLDRLGMLSFDSWRASRLVVDTGIHAMKWTRADAESFMLANTPLAANNIKNEVDRYITWPGQALAYKTGQIAIRELRKEAEVAMGPKFSLAGFHDVVLGGGAVTLPVLQQRVRAWIAAGV